MKFAAILGAAAVLTAGAASAAEIGVRHTWGTTDRHITNGQSWAVQGGFEQYTEQSAGFALGVVADEFKSEGLSVEPFVLSSFEGSVFGPGGTIINEDELIDNDPDITGIDMFANDAIGGAAAGSSASASASTGAASAGGALGSTDASNSAAATANSGNAAPGGDATVAPSITGDLILDNYDGGTVVQIAEAGVEGSSESLFVTGGLVGTPDMVDGKLAVSGSGYLRESAGFNAYAAGETYQFTGSTHTGFSELSTFSR